VKIERDLRNGNQTTAYQYGYNSDGGKVWKKDHLNQQEYRYLCRIGCGGTPMRAYNRAMGNASWTSVEDYLPAGSALGYDQNWQFRYSGGEWLMMGMSGEPSGYYPTDSNGLNLLNAPSAPCKCAVVVPTQTAVCPPLGYGGCEETLRLPLQIPNPKDIQKCLRKCRGKQGKAFLECMARCLGKRGGRKFCEDNYCRVFPKAEECTKGNPCNIPNPTTTDCQHCCDIKYFCCLIFNPPGTIGAMRCLSEHRRCNTECLALPPVNLTPLQ